MGKHTDREVGELATAIISLSSEEGLGKAKSWEKEERRDTQVAFLTEKPPNGRKLLIVKNRQEGNTTTGKQWLTGDFHLLLCNFYIL